jgi:hypothetical protein
MMVKPKPTKRRKRHAPRSKDQAARYASTSHAPRPPYANPLAIPTYWTPEQAIAVFELIDDLRETICALYLTDLQDMIHQQRQPANLDLNDDIPF